MPIFATEYTEINCLPGFTVDTDLFSVDLVVALDGDVECLFVVILSNDNDGYIHLPFQKFGHHPLIHFLICGLRL